MSNQEPEAHVRDTSGSRPRSGSPNLPPPAVAVFGSGGGGVTERAQATSPPRLAFQLAGGGAGLRRRSGSGSPVPPALWAARREERPRYERDSLRNRSLEGRPGSRKHRRYTRSVEIMGSFRRAMAKCGEDASITDAEALQLVYKQEVEWRPSAFYRLLQQEGAEGALDALEAAEVAKAAARRAPRTPGTKELEGRNERTVRRVFADTWQYLRDNLPERELLGSLEAELVRAFGPPSAGPPEITLGEEKEASAEVAPERLTGNTNVVALLWMLGWDGSELTTLFGSPPAKELGVAGLTATQRKVAHQLARALGLHSESREVKIQQRGPDDDGKVVVVRPTRNQQCGSVGTWVAPFSVAQVLAGA